MIQITKLGTAFLGSTEDLECLRKQFDREHYIRLHKIFEPGLIEILHCQIERAEFHEKIHEGIGLNKELCMPENTIHGILHLLLNSENLFQIVQQITQCGPIGCFMGRVYRVVPGWGHCDAWHGDVGEHRLVAMSINFSKKAYFGGILQIRDRKSRQILGQIINSGFGDAVIFRIAHSLEHQITEVKGTVPKTAFAGWFKSQPDFPSILKTCRERSCSY